MNHARKPRLLLIGARPPPAIGPCVAMERLLAAPALAGAFTVDFLDISDHRDIRSMGRFDLGNLWLGLGGAVRAAWRLLWRRPDVVYLGLSQGLWGYLRDLAFILPAQARGCRVILHLRGSEFRSFYEALPGVLRGVTRAMLWRTSRMIVLGENLRGVFDGLVPVARLAVIPNGIACETWPARHAPAPPVGGGRVLYLSHLSRRKGLLVLLQAWAELAPRYPAARLTVAGQWQDAAVETAARSLIAQHGLAGRVLFAGEVGGAAKQQLYAEHDLFVFPPVAPEGLPWVILEAMAASLPVVTTDQGAITEVVAHAETGCVVAPTPAAVAAAVAALLEDPGRAQAMGAAGRQRVETRFSERLYLDKLVAEFMAVAGEPASA